MRIPFISKREIITTKQSPDKSMVQLAQPISNIKVGWTWGDFTTQVNELTYTDKKNAYYNNPIVHKGINKKTRDCIFDWFEIDNPLDTEDVPEDVEKT